MLILGTLENEGSPIEFLIPGNGSEYLDLSMTRLKLKIKITTEKGEDIPSDNDKVGIINNFFHSLFSNVQVELNQRCISTQNNLHPFKAYITNLLSYGSDSKNTFLQNQCYFKDTDDMSASELNDGFVARRKLISREFELYGPLMTDLFLQPRYLVDHVQMLVRLHRTKPDFLILKKQTDDNRYVVKITDAILLIRKLKISPAVLLAHSTALNYSSFKYPICRIEMKSMNIGINQISTSFDNVFLGLSII